VILIDARLASTAAVRAATLATEAKTLALFEAGVKTEAGSPATGTSMDTIVVASTGRGPFSRYAGTSTLVGHLIGQAVYEAVAEGIRLEQGAPASP
jgi:iron complex transport system ATP-binding protein